MGGGSGGGSQSTTSEQRLDPSVKAQLDLLTQYGTSAGSQPYQAYNGPRIADFTSDQQAGFNAVRANVGTGQDQYNLASGIAGQVGTYTPQSWNSTTASNYMNPYTQNVVDTTNAELQRQNDILQAKTGSTAAGSGAFGGSREALLEAENNKNLQTTIANTDANLYRSGYTDAQTQFNADANRDLSGQQTNLSAANSLGNLGTGQYQLAMNGANALLGIGGQQQQMDQNNLNLAYSDFQNQTQYPWSQVKNLANIFGTYAGLGQGSTSTTTSSGPSAMGQIAGLGAAGIGALGAAGAFSSKNGGVVGYPVGGVVGMTGMTPVYTFEKPREASDGTSIIELLGGPPGMPLNAAQLYEGNYSDFLDPLGGDPLNIGGQSNPGLLSKWFMRGGGIAGYPMGGVARQMGQSTTTYVPNGDASASQLLNAAQMAKMGRDAYNAGKWIRGKLSPTSSNGLPLSGQETGQYGIGAEPVPVSSEPLAATAPIEPVTVSPLAPDTGIGAISEPISAPITTDAITGAAVESGADAASAAAAADAATIAGTDAAAGSLLGAGMDAGLAGAALADLGTIGGLAGAGIGGAEAATAMGIGAEVAGSAMAGEAAAAGIGEIAMEVAPLILLAAKGGIVGRYDDGGDVLSDDQWNAMTPEQQAAYLYQQTPSPQPGQGIAVDGNATGNYSSLFPASAAAGIAGGAPASSSPGGSDGTSSNKGDLWTALMMAGFGAMGSRSPNALGAIGEGAQTGLSSYQQLQKSRQDQARLAREQQTKDRQLAIQQQNADQTGRYYQSLASKPSTSDYERKYNTWLSTHPGDTAGALSYAAGNDPTDDGSDPAKAGKTAVDQFLRAQTALNTQKGRLNAAVTAFRNNNFRDPTPAEIGVMNDRLGISKLESDVAMLRKKAGMDVAGDSGGSGLPPAQGPLAGSAATASSGAPAVGTVLQGYRFTGGDPADRNNWVRVQ